VSIVVRYGPTDLTKQKYDETMQAINSELGEDAPDGARLHVCFGEDGALRISEIWDSREQWQAFGEKLMPILAKMGIQPGPPEVYEVHNLLAV
jgi:hypothetical protein